MARKIKIDNAELKRFARTQQKRQMGNRPNRQYFLIVCEGAKTEPNYFEFAQHNPCTKVYKLIIELNQLKV